MVYQITEQQVDCKMTIRPTCCHVATVHPEPHEPLHYMTEEVRHAGPKIRLVRLRTPHVELHT